MCMGFLRIVGPGIPGRNDMMTKASALVKYWKPK